MSDEEFADAGVNIQEKETVILNIANALFGYFKPHEYGLVILSLTVMKRFHDCLLPTHAAVQEQYEKVKKLAVIDGFLTRASGYQFYNTSKFTFDLLLADPDNIEASSGLLPESQVRRTCPSSGCPGSVRPDRYRRCGYDGFVRRSAATKAMLELCNTVWVAVIKVSRV